MSEDAYGARKSEDTGGIEADLLRLAFISSLSPQSPLAAEDLNISEYTHRILFGGRVAESFSAPLSIQCQEYPFKVWSN